MATGQGEDESLVGPQGEGDIVGESLAGLQGQVAGRMRQAQQEAERAKRYQQKVGFFYTFQGLLCLFDCFT